MKPDIYKYLSTKLVCALCVWLDVSMGIVFQNLGKAWFGVQQMCNRYFLTHRLNLSSVVPHLREHGSYHNRQQDLQLIRVFATCEAPTASQSQNLCYGCALSLCALLPLRPSYTQSLRLVLTTRYFPFRRIILRSFGLVWATRYFLQDILFHFLNQAVYNHCVLLHAVYLPIFPTPP